MRYNTCECDSATSSQRCVYVLGCFLVPTGLTVSNGVAWYDTLSTLPFYCMISARFQAADKLQSGPQEPIGSGFPYGGGHMKVSHAESWPGYPSGTNHIAMTQRRDTIHDERDIHRNVTVNPTTWSIHQDLGAHAVVGRGGYNGHTALNHSGDSRWTVPVGELRAAHTKRHTWHPQDEFERPMPYMLQHGPDNCQSSYVDRPLSYGGGMTSRRTNPGLASLHQQELEVNAMLDKLSGPSKDDLAHLLRIWGIDGRHIKRLTVCCDGCLCCCGCWCDCFCVC